MFKFKGSKHSNFADTKPLNEKSLKFHGISMGTSGKSCAENLGVSMTAFIIFLFLTFSQASLIISFGGVSEIIYAVSVPISQSPETFNLSGTLVAANPANGCGPLIGDNYAGKIVFVSQDFCSPQTKMYNVEMAGGIGAVLVSHILSAGFLRYTLPGPLQYLNLAIPALEITRGYKLTFLTCD
jgi:hypothetical protein